MAYNWTTEWPGVYAQHASDCPLRSGGECTCAQIAYRASAKAPDERSRLLSPEFASAIDARNWLREQRARLTAATAVADEGPSLGTVIQEFLTSADRGLRRDLGDGGASQERLLEVREGLGYVGGELGARRIQAVRRRDVQVLVDRLDAAGVPADRINGVISSLRVLFAYAIQRDLVDFNPVVQLRLPHTPAPAPKPVPADITDYTAYYNGNGSHNGNGNGNGPGYREDDVATMPYAPAFTAPAAPSFTDGAEEPSDHWTPGVFDRFEFGDDPFDREPSAPAPMPAPSVVSDPLHAMPPAAQPPFAPPAAAMPMPTLGPPLANAQTQYGTPAYGTQAVTTQVPAQPAAAAGSDVMLSEQMFWWITRIVVIVFVLIALVLAAESI